MLGLSLVVDKDILSYVFVGIKWRIGEKTNGRVD